jgi:hypothetical protein
MPIDPRGRLFGRIVLPAVAAAALGVFALGATPAAAQPYLGWDFGGGIGVGIGPPPSAYNPCPNYGWPYYPYPCRYAYYPPPRPHKRSVHHARKPPARVTQAPPAPAAPAATSN